MASKFKFRARSGALNWKLISSVDVDAVVEFGLVGELQAVLDSATFCEFGPRDVSNNDVASTCRLVKLMQLSIEYLLHCQEKHCELIQAVHDKNTAAKKQVSLLKEQNAALLEDTKIYKKQLSMSQGGFKNEEISLEAKRTIEGEEEEMMARRKLSAGGNTTTAASENENQKLRELLQSLFEEQRREFLESRASSEEQKTQERSEQIATTITTTTTTAATPIPEGWINELRERVESMLHAVIETTRRAAEEQRRDAQRMGESKSSLEAIRECEEHALEDLLLKASDAVYEEELSKREMEASKREFNLIAQERALQEKERQLQREREMERERVIQLERERDREREREREQQERETAQALVTRVIAVSNTMATSTSSLQIRLAEEEEEIAKGLRKRGRAIIVKNFLSLLAQVLWKKKHRAFRKWMDLMLDRRDFEQFYERSRLVEEHQQRERALQVRVLAEEARYHSLTQTAVEERRQMQEQMRLEAEERVASSRIVASRRSDASVMTSLEQLVRPMSTPLIITARTNSSSSSASEEEFSVSSSSPLEVSSSSSQDFSLALAQLKRDTTEGITEEEMFANAHSKIRSQITPVNQTDTLRILAQELLKRSQRK